MHSHFFQGVCIHSSCPNGTMSTPMLQMVSSSTKLDNDSTECDTPKSESCQEDFVLDAESMAQCDDPEAVEESPTLQVYCIYGQI